MAAVFTVGHSTRSIEEFIQIVQAHGVARVVDVRLMPGSRRHPQFNRQALAASLNAAGIEYAHLPGLGGLRKPRPDSENAGWRNDSFRGYADYMQTPEFLDSLQAVLDLAEGERLALMCAEAVPWRCHRSLIADALVVRGLRVEHILGPERAHPHALTDFARVDGTKITYPSEN